MGCGISKFDPEGDGPPGKLSPLRRRMEEITRRRRSDRVLGGGDLSTKQLLEDAGDSADIDSLANDGRRSSSPRRNGGFIKELHLQEENARPSDSDKTGEKFLANDGRKSVSSSKRNGGFVKESRLQEEKTSPSNSDKTEEKFLAGDGHKNVSSPRRNGGFVKEQRLREEKTRLSDSDKTAEKLFANDDRKSISSPRRNSEFAQERREKMRPYDFDKIGEKFLVNDGHRSASSPTRNREFTRETRVQEEKTRPSDSDKIGEKFLGDGIERDKVKTKVRSEKEARKETGVYAGVVEEKNGEHDGKTEDEEEEEDEDEDDKAGFSDREDSLLCPGSPSFRDYCINCNSNDGGKDEGRGNGAKGENKTQQEGFARPISNKQDSKNQLATRGRRRRGLGRVLPKGTPTAVKNFLNASTRYNPNTSSSHDNPKPRKLPAGN